MNIGQLIANALAQGALYTLISLSMALALYPLRVFHAALGGLVAVAGYAMAVGTTVLGLALMVSVAGSLVIAAVLGVVLEWTVYRPLFVRRASTLAVAISSFAAYLVIVNALSAMFSSQHGVIPGVRRLILMGPVVLTTEQVAMIGCSIGVFLLLALGLKTRFGLALRAMEDTPELLRTFGWNIMELRTTCILLSSMLAGLAGVLTAYDTGVEPTMGMSAVLNALVVVIVAGSGSYRGIFLVAPLLALVQTMFGYAVSPRWQAAVSFTVLTAFLVFRPGGIFSGHRRVEEIV